MTFLLLSWRKKERGREEREERERRERREGKRRRRKRRKFSYQLEMDVLKLPRGEFLGVSGSFLHAAFNTGFQNRNDREFQFTQSCKTGAFASLKF